MSASNLSKPAGPPGGQPARRVMDESRAQLALVRRAAWNYVGDRELDDLLEKALEKMDAYTSRWTGGTA